MRFGRRGLPELVHEFPIDPPAVPFISDKSLLHPPACSRRLLSSLPTPPQATAEKSPVLSALSPPRGFLSLGGAPSLPLNLTPHTASWAPSHREEGMGAPIVGRECGAVRPDRRGLHREPQLRGDPGIVLCPAPQQALRRQPALFLSFSPPLSLSLSFSDPGESWARRRSPCRSPM